MNNLLRLSCIRALLPGLVMGAVPAVASAQPRFMGPRMGNPGMAQLPGAAAMTRPFHGMPIFNVGAMSPATTPGMAPAMRPMSATSGGASAMGSGGYGMGAYSGQTYGGYGMGAYNGEAYGNPGASTDPQANAADPRSTENKAASSLLTASGVPNDHGQLRWPLGLTILAAPGVDELSERIEALFEETARQAADGPVNPVLVDEARRAVHQLRALLLKEKAERFGMPLAVYQESEHFLDKLDRAGQLFRAGLGKPGGQRDANGSQKETR
jgi:hypothetical protein